MRYSKSNQRFRPINPGARQYTIGFSNNYLIRGVIKSLRDEGFIPEQLDKPYI